MRNRALLSALALCLSVAACESKKDEPPKPKTAQAVVPLPPEAPKPAAASAEQDAKPMQVADNKAAATSPSKRTVRPGSKGCGNGKCIVNVKTVTPGKPYCTGTYNADKLEVAGQHETITWNVAGGWKFDNDGVELPVGGQQFTGATGAGGTKYSVVDENSDDKTYKYKLHLVKGADKCTIDPSIVNGAETIDPDYPPQ
jgi:hypothetical protein